jgi:hypothetical protein
MRAGAIARNGPAELPRWLVGDWGRLLRDPVDLLRLALLVGVPITLALGPREQSFRLLLTFALALSPRALDVPRLFDLAFVMAMSFQAWGNVFGAFDGVYGYDKVVHFLLPCASSALLYLLLVRVRVVPDLAEETGVHRKPAVLLVTAAFGLALMGGLYELYEWFADHFLGGHLYVSYGDSIGDLLDDALGALAGGALILAWEAQRWGTRRLPLPRPGNGGEEDPVSAVGDRVVATLQPDPDQASRRRRRRPSLPAALVGDWSGPLRDPLDLLRLSLLVGLAIALGGGEWDTALRFALSLLAVLVVRALDAPRPFDLLFLGAMGIQAWGSLAGALDSGGALNSLTHLVVSAAAGPVLYLAVVRLRLLPELSRRTTIHQSAAVALTVFSLGFSVGILYELYVYFATHVLSASIVVSYPTLIGGLALDALGALAGAALVAAWGLANWPLRRAPGSELGGR